MRTYLAILKYALKYKSSLALSIIFNIISIFFSAVSLTMLIPFLQVLFNRASPIRELPPFSLSAQWMLDFFNYHIGKILISEGPMSALLWVCIVVVIMFFMKNLTRYLGQFFMAKVRNGLLRDLRQALYDKVISLPVSFFTYRRQGDLISRITTDVQEIEWSIVNMIEVVIKEPLTIIAYLTLLLIMSPQLTLFILLLLPITGFIIGQIGKSLKKESVEAQNLTGRLAALVEETIRGITIVKIFTAEKLLKNIFKTVNERLYKARLNSLRKRELSSPLSEFLGIVIVVIVLWFGGRMVLSGTSSLTPETFITFVVIFSQIINPAKSFATAFYHIQRGMAAAERVMEILTTEDNVPQPKNPIYISSFDNSIRFEHVWFAYDKQNFVLKDINLTIKQGEKVALVGPSGAGKTTLVYLIPRFYDPTKGKISIDSHDLRTLDIYSLRKLIAMVPQEPIIFHDTILNNIRLGNPSASMEEVINAAKAAHAHEFIVNLPDGYETVVGERGLRLSGGQRQRIAIARALLKNAPILILDEATSNLDAESEQLVQKGLENLMKGRTAIIIAHRLATVKQSDRIIVLDKGRIVEQGTHEELIKQNGLYASLVSKQNLMETNPPS